MISFTYYYSMVCGKCGYKISDLAATTNGSNTHSFTLIDGGYFCPGCGENKEFNIISAVAKTYKEF